MHVQAHGDSCLCAGMVKPRSCRKLRARSKSLCHGWQLQVQQPIIAQDNLDAFMQKSCLPLCKVVPRFNTQAVANMPKPQDHHSHNVGKAHLALLLVLKEITERVTGDEVKPKAPSMPDML